MCLLGNRLANFFIAISKIKVHEVFQGLPPAWIVECFRTRANCRERGTVFVGKKDHVLNIPCVTTNELRSDEILDRRTREQQSADPLNEHRFEHAYLRWAWLDQLDIRLVGVQGGFWVESQPRRFDSRFQLEEIVVTCRLPDVDIPGSA